MVPSILPSLESVPGSQHVHACIEVGKFLTVLPAVVTYPDGVNR